MAFKLTDNRHGVPQDKDSSASGKPLGSILKFFTQRAMPWILFSLPMEGWST